MQMDAGVRSLESLDLPYIALDDPQLAADPAFSFAQARRDHPWLAKGPFSYVLTDYAAIRELMVHDDKMVVGYAQAVDLIGAAGTPWGEFIKHALQNQKGDLHRRLRDALAPAFTPRAANQHRPIMREVIAGLLDDWTPKRTFDFEEFASYFPITVLCRVIGAPPEAVPSLRASLDVLGLGGNFDASYVPRFNEAFAVVDDFVRKIAAERRASGSISAEPDLLDHLLRITDDGGITDDELFNLLIFLFVGGYDTSKNVMTLIMDLMIDRPADYARCATDQDFCRRVVEETFRYRGVSSSPRVVLEPFDFRGVHVPAGAMLFVPWGVSGRDPGAFEDPDTFNPERRSRNAMIQFGLGPHMCLGQFLARVQIEEALHLIAQRISKPKRLAPRNWRAFPGVWGLRGLPIEFDPAGPASPSDASTETN